jgi:hypothetical protein
LAGDPRAVLSFAPRIPQRLLDEIERQSGLYRPSYEQVRVLVHAARRLRRQAPAPVSTVAMQVAFRVRPPEAILPRLFEPAAPRLRDRAPPK